VFSGRKGNYSEKDSPDPEDLYGRSKLLGEVIGENCLTLRTSMIGHELEGSHGLLEWFLSQNGGRVRGFKRAVFCGFVTPALAQTLARIISDYPRLSGIRHVASQAINKFDLLSLVKSVYELNVDIEPDETVVCDRSLDGSLFESETGIRAPSWPEMIVQMHEDAKVYDQLRRVDAAR
jgi:dTDP-4-dehydrorhamnose reductase